MPKLKRSEVKYPGLVKEVHPRTRWEQLELDYVHKLSEEDKQWLSDFNEEFVGANFKCGKTKKRRFHRVARTRKQCTDRNNARNRDIHTLLKTGGWDCPLENAKQIVTNSPEDALIEFMDIKNKIQES